jgi:uncharacterized membrane protein YeiH
MNLVALIWAAFADVVLAPTCAMKNVLSHIIAGVIVTVFGGFLTHVLVKNFKSGGHGHSYSISARR